MAPLTAVMLYVAVLSAVVVAVPLEIEFEFAPQVVVGPEIAPGVAIDATLKVRHALVPQLLLIALTFTVPVTEPVQEV